MGLLPGSNALLMVLVVTSGGLQGQTGSAPPVYVGERHHEALAYWVQLVNDGRLPFEKHTILHIDSHMDFGDGPKTFNGSDWPPTAGDIMNHVEIGDFLSLAVWLGLSDDFIFLAPPWEMQFRQEMSSADLQVVVGEGKDGLLKFSVISSTPSMVTTSLDGVFGKNLVNETERKSLRRPVQCRIRVVPAETAFDFLASGRLFEGQNHTRLLLDVDMDVLATTSTGSQELTQHGMEETLLMRIHRIHTGFDEDLVTKFHRDAKKPALLPNWTVVNNSVERVFADYSLPDWRSSERLTAVKEKLAAMSEGLQSGAHDANGKARRQKALMTLVQSKGSWLEQLNPNGSELVGACFGKSMEQPYQISTEEEIHYLAAFWEDFFRELPVLPAAVTVVRSPEYSPLHTMRLQECRLLAAFQRTWPGAPLEAAEGFEQWHQNCSEDFGNVSTWLPQSKGILPDVPFDEVYKDYKEWNDGVDPLSDLDCEIDDYDEDEDEDEEDEEDEDQVNVLVENTCPAGGKISLTWRNANASSGGPLDPLNCGASEKFDSFPGHVLTARCAEKGQEDQEEVYFEVQAKVGGEEEDCKDNDKQCGKWATRGECSNNPAYMNNNCKKACHVCKESSDDYDEAVVWKVALPNCGQGNAHTTAPSNEL